MRKMQTLFLVLGSFGFLGTAWAEKACFEVQGMTCATCPLTVKGAVKRLRGIDDVMASLKDKNAVINFDPQKINAAEIKKAIDSVGYKAIPQDCKQNNKG